MRNISFSLTEAQFLDGSKDVTRRLRWLFLRAGDRLMACRKCMGLRPGESIVRLGEIEVVSTRREKLSCLIVDPDYGQAEAMREGFPKLTGKQFVEMFRSHMVVPADGMVTRIEFKPISSRPNQSS
jgi:hypothetical protein